MKHSQISLPAVCLPALYHERERITLREPAQNRQPFFNAAPKLLNMFLFCHGFLDLNIMTCQDATNVGYILGLRFCQQTQILRLNFFYRHATTKTDRFNMTTCLRRCGCMHCKDLQTWMGIILIKCVIPTCYTYYTNKTSTCMHRNSQKVNISQGRSLSR